MLLTITGNQHCATRFPVGRKLTPVSEKELAVSFLIDLGLCIMTLCSSFLACTASCSGLPL